MHFAALAGHHPVNRECISQLSPVIIRSTENPFCGCHWSSASQSLVSY
jgi:hypothetical protein